MGLSIFDRIAQSKAAGGGNYFKQGKGTLIINKILLETKEEGPTFIAEFKVKSSESYPGAVDDKGRPEFANAPGTEVSFVQKLEKHKSAMGNTKAFIEALEGYGPNEMPQDKFVEMLKSYVNQDPDAKDASGEPRGINPGRGFEIDYSTFQKPKRSNKTEILTLVRFAHRPGQSAATRDANLKVLDGAA